jgi:hypothetical protein
MCGAREIDFTEADLLATPIMHFEVLRDGPELFPFNPVRRQPGGVLLLAAAISRTPQGSKRDQPAHKWAEPIRAIGGLSVPFTM